MKFSRFQKISAALIVTLVLAAIIVLQLDVPGLESPWGKFSPSQREQKIVNFFKELGRSNNPDYAVVKVDAAGVGTTTIVFGFVDNREVCQEIADLFNRSSTGTVPGTYRCDAIN